MNWIKANNVWQWLVLSSPAFVMVLCGTILPGWLESDSDGGYDKITRISVGLDGIMVAALMSLILGFWWAWKAQDSLQERCVFGLVYAIAIAFVNLAVAYAGCSAPLIISSALSR